MAKVRRSLASQLGLAPFLLGSRAHCPTLDLTSFTSRHFTKTCLLTVTSSILSAHSYYPATSAMADECGQTYGTTTITGQATAILGNEYNYGSNFNIQNATIIICRHCSEPGYTPDFQRNLEAYHQTNSSSLPIRTPHHSYKPDPAVYSPPQVQKVSNRPFGTEMVQGLYLGAFQTEQFQQHDGYVSASARNGRDDSVASVSQPSLNSDTGGPKEETSVMVGKTNTQKEDNSLLSIGSDPISTSLLLKRSPKARKRRESF